MAHRSIEIGDDVWTGHNVYLTDMNHGYEDVELPISVQNQPEAPVVIGDGSWLGHGVVVLPGAHIGRHVVIGANSRRDRRDPRLQRGGGRAGPGDPGARRRAGLDRSARRRARAQGVDAPKR